jgi:hypothetical protein
MEPLPRRTATMVLGMPSLPGQFRRVSGRGPADCLLGGAGRRPGFPATLPHALETGKASQATSYAKPTREAR